MRLGSSLALVVFAVCATEAGAAPAYPFQDASLSPNARVDDFVGRLTLEEKISLLSGEDNWHLPSIARLGVRGLVMTDGPAGLRNFQSLPSTAFPVGAAAGATWDPALIRQEGRAIGEETIAQGVDIILGPDVNIVRIPVGGRNFETFSEDPVLTGQMGSAYVEGAQKAGAGVALKHFVANEQENGRNSGDSVVSERALREIYLAGFEPIVKNAAPWSVMTAYPHVNGTYMSENEILLQNVLRDDWGFQGVVMSDWNGTHSTAGGIEAGLDLEMPGPAVWRGWTLEQAVKNGQIDEKFVENSVRRIAMMMLRAQILDPSETKRGSLNTAQHQAIAEKVAEEGTVLLKNDGVLPLDRKAVKTVAIIGAPADHPAFQGGGSSQVVPAHIVTPLAALRAHYGKDVNFIYAQGVDNEPRIPAVDSRLLSPTRDRKEIGLHAVYYQDGGFQGGVAFEKTDNYFLKFGFGGSAAAVDDSKMPQGLQATADAIAKGQYAQDQWKAGMGFSVKWTGYFFAPKDGTYEFSMVHDDSATLTLDGKVLINDASRSYAAPIFCFFDHLKERRASVALKAGQAYPIEIDFSATPNSSIRYDQKVFELGVRAPAGTIAEAVDAARKADVAIVFAGAGRTADAEGTDRPGIDFDPAQNRLIDAVAAANPKTVVVVNDGSSVTMPWKDKVRAILDTWLPGQEGGTAIAKILFGEVNPSGHLPITFARRIEDSPAFLSYSSGPVQFYDDDIFVGYRGYEKRKIAPLFPFGYGLSYTRFDFGPLKSPNIVKANENVALSIKLTNTGKRAGTEVVQLYVQDAHAPVTMPVKALKTFARVELRPGESKVAALTLTPRDLSYWDVETHKWVQDPGQFNVMAGPSSQGIRSTASFMLLGGAGLTADAAQ